MPSEHDAIGQLLHDTYTLERVIGKGAMGVVYEASHTRLSRKFAVKLLQPSAAADKEFLERFHREAEITSNLRHPNLIEIIDFNSTPEGAPYIVMELLEGESLQTRLDRTPQLELELTAAILKQTASALEVAHEHGIVHRDLKPENIFLCRIGKENDQVKVLDFGLSKVIGLSRLTQTNLVLGTPYYMSPEQAQGHSSQTERAADIFALGSILYTMLAGRLPFSGDDGHIVLHKVIHEEPPPLREHNPEVPEEVEQVLAKAMSKRPEDRYTTAEELSVAFHLALEQGSGEKLDTRPYLSAAESGAFDKTLPSGARRPLDTTEPSPPPVELGLTEAPELLGITEPKVTHRPLDVTEPPEPERPLDLTEAPLDLTDREHQLVVTDPYKGGPGRFPAPDNAPTFLDARRPPRPLRRFGLPAVVVAVVAGLVGAGVVFWGKSDPDPKSALDSGTSATAVDSAVVDLRPVADSRRSDLTPTPDTVPSKTTPTRPRVPRRRLDLTTTPGGADLFVNGRRVGRTPIRGRAIPTRRVTLLIRKTGFKERRETIEKGSHRISRTVALVATFGKVSVAARYDGKPVRKAVIYVDGVPKGTTPKLIKLPTGPHRIEVRKTGYRPGRKTVRVLEGRQVVIIELRKR